MHKNILAATALAVLTLAACGGGGSSATPSTGSGGGGGSTSTPIPGAPASTPVQETISGKTYLAGANGHTLYIFSADTTNASNCTSSTGCTGVWPPYSAPAGTSAPSGTAFTIFTRTDGTLQWASSGHPLYDYSGDSASAQLNGQGITSFGGSWSAATASSSSSPGGGNPYISR